MPRRYYSSRKEAQSLSLEDLYWKLKNLYLLFRNKNYFQRYAGITEQNLPDAIQHEAAIALSFQPFPVTKWSESEITEDHIFYTIEFLFDHVAKPGEWGAMVDNGYSYYGYIDYDDVAGRTEFRETTNAFLSDYKEGYELTEDGTILTLSSGGLQNILVAEIIPFDEIHVDRGLTPSRCTS